MTESKGKGYLHGFSEEEQNRLYQQARFLEDKIYQRITFPKGARILEVGCGVGAQSEILLERFPTISIVGVDANPAQIDRAKKHLPEALKSKRIEFLQSSGEKLPFENDSFEGAFICWLLEHVSDPLALLQETKRLLKSGGILYCTEVMNATFFVHPYSPATLQYWFAFNDHQWSMGGDPFVGAKLGNYLFKAGFQNVETEVQSYHFDSRAPKRRAQMFAFWKQLLMSGTASLLAAGKVTQELVDQMGAELETLKADPDSVFFYSTMQARGMVY